MYKILTTQQVKSVEDKANESGISYLRLMENAGSACAKIIRNRFDETGIRDVLIICGKGKNGGDGFVIARKLYENGYRVKILLALGNPGAENAVEMENRVRDLGIPIAMYNEQNSAQIDVIEKSDIIVDCIFGTGFRGRADEQTERLFKRISASDGYVVSIDLPSGLNADSNLVEGEAVKADLTISIIALKRALVYFPSCEYAGNIKTVNIGVHDEIIDEFCNTYSLEYKDIKAKMPKRNEESNKGDFGKVLAICGSYEMPGAALMSTAAANEAGSGIVKLAFPDKAYPVMMSMTPEKVLVPLPSNKYGKFSTNAIPRLKDEIKNCDAILLGCGIGQDNDTLNIVRFVLSHAKVPVVLDADGINLISTNIDILRNAKCPVVITPHPGEAARLLGVSVQAVQQDRILSAKMLYEKFGVTVVLKGSRTVITNDGKRFYINMTGNSGMATAGSGDVLAGMILSFIGQGLSPYVASAAAVYIHGLCGDLVSEKYSKQGTTAAKIIDEIAKTLSKF